MIEKLKELMEDEEFLTKVAVAKTEDAIVAVMAEYGIQMTAAQVKEILAQDMGENENGELSEDMLDNVSGGGKIWDWVKGKFNSWFKKQSEKNARDIQNLISGL